MGKKEYADLMKDGKNKDQNGLEISDSEDEPEDEFGDLVNDTIQTKFLTTLAKLKTKNKEIYDTEKEFFHQSDFEDEEEDQNDQDNSKKFGYKEMVQKQITDKMNKQNGSDDGSDEDSDQEQLRKLKEKQLETPHQEQQRLKQEFKKQIQNEDEGSDDDLFKVKKKTSTQMEEEQNNFESWEKKAKRRNNKEADLVKNMWGSEDKLDEKDKFLRNYILSKAWIDKDDYDEAQQKADEEDSQREDEMDNFEVDYNFRFEQPGAKAIITYDRNITDSVRVKDSTRSDKRKEKKNQKDQEKQRLEEEIKQLKNAKKNQIMNRLQKIEKIGGVVDEKIQKDEDFEQFLEKDFDEEEYSKMMKKKFGKKYRKEDDLDDEELQQYEEGLEKKGDLLDDEEIEPTQKDITHEQSIQKKIQKDDKEVTQIKANIPIALKKNLNKEDVEAIQEEKEDDEDYNMICWYCDNCKRGLQPGEQRFDCLECPDYVLCKQCNSAEIHKEHKMKKFQVPSNCAPPEEEVLQKIINNFKICNKCDCKLNEYTNIYTLNDSKNGYHLCDSCFDKERFVNQENYTCTKSTKVDISQILEKGDVSKVQDHFSDEIIDKLVNEYYSLDFEDVIAGGIKTKFRYTSVPAESYGLSDENLLYADPKLLNSYVSIKKMAPYRDDEGRVLDKVKKNTVKLNQIENSTRLVKYQIRKEDQKIKSIEEKIAKLKRSKKPKAEKKIVIYQKSLQELKEQKLKPLSADFFKQLARKGVQESDDENDDEDASDEEKGGEEKQKKQKKNKKERVQIQDLSNPATNKNISSNRLKSYGLNKDL